MSPLSTIAITKLQGPPYYATFWYLFDQLGVLIVIGCAIVAAFSALGKADVKEITDEGGLREIIIRAIKVNIVSAILDNATLTAAELSPAMAQDQINAALMGLLIFLSLRLEILQLAKIALSRKA